MTSYNPNVPLANNSPSQDQPVMLLNSQTWNGTWGQDHQPYGSSANVGFSNQLTLIRQLTAVAPNINNGRLFCMPDSNGVGQLYWRAASVDGGAIQQLTAAIAGGSGSAGSSGYVSYFQSVGSNTATIQQWFWVLQGSLQIKLISINIPTGSGNPALTGVTYFGNSSVAAPFSSQPIFGIYTAPSGSGSSANGVTCYSSSMPSSTPSLVGAYINGAYLLCNPLQTYKYMIIGI